MIGRRRYHLHLPGVIFVALTVLIGAATSQRRGNLLVWVFASMLAWIIVSGIISGGMMMAVRMRRIAPRSGRVGEPLIIRYEVTCESRFWPIFDLRINEQIPGKWKSAYLMHCRRGESITVEGEFLPEVRGRLLLRRSRCLSGFPFGLIMKSVEFLQDSEVLIHPKVSKLHPQALRRLLIARGDEGRRMNSARGGGDEFHGLRDYRPGDSLRSVAWRRSASLPELVVVDRSAPIPWRLAIALDLRITEPAQTRDAEEQAIAMTASLLHHAEQSGWEISLDVLGCAAIDVPMRRGGRHVNQILDALAAVDLDAPRSVNGAQHEVRRGIDLIIYPGPIHSGTPRSYGHLDHCVAISATSIAATCGDSSNG